MFSEDIVGSVEAYDERQIAVADDWQLHRLSQHTVPFDSWLMSRPIYWHPTVTIPPHCQSILYIFRDVKRRIITCRWNPGLRISRLMTTHIHFVNLCTFCTLLKSTILAGTIFRHDSIRFYTAYSREAVGHISGGALLLFKVIEIGGPYQETPDSEIHESARRL